MPFSGSRGRLHCFFWSLHFDIVSTCAPVPTARFRSPSKSPTSRALFAYIYSIQYTLALKCMEKVVLFLDIDGICHPADACGPMPDGTVFGDDLFRWVAPLLQLLDEMPHVDVVLHSSWRHTYRGDLPRLLQDLPPALAARVVGVTPLKFGRQESIEVYVNRYRIEHYVAIDDAKFQFDDDLPWLVLSGPDGLSKPETVQALREALIRA